MLINIIEEVWIDDEEVRRLFGEPAGSTPITLVVDDELGLEVVEVETVLTKYGITLDTSKSFHRSLQEFFDKTGFLTPKQLNAIKG